MTFGDDFQPPQPPPPGEPEKVDPQLLIDALRSLEEVRAESRRLSELLGPFSEMTFPDKDGREIAVLGWEAGTSDTARQFKIEPTSNGGARMYYGQVYGMGFSGTVDGLTDGDWESFAGVNGKLFILKVEFDPKARAETIFDGLGGAETIYVLDEGGSNASVSVFTKGSLPSDTQPSVSPTDGKTVAQGIYHIELGRITNGQAETHYKGPLGIGFCPPNSAKIWETAT